MLPQTLAAPPVSSNVSFHGLKSRDNVVFFGNTLGISCQRCGAYERTDSGHRYCAHVSCPMALLEFKRRKRKRTSTLERVLIPRLAQHPSPGLVG